MGKRSAARPIRLANVISFLKYPQQVRPETKPKSRFLKRDFVRALKDSGFSVDTKDPLYQYWYTHVDDIPNSAVPSEWDWRSVNGVNYVNPSRAQVGCS